MVHNQHLDAVSTFADVSKTQNGQAALSDMHAMAACVNTSDFVGAMGTRQWAKFIQRLMTHDCTSQHSFAHADIEFAGALTVVLVLQVLFLPRAGQQPPGVKTPLSLLNPCLGGSAPAASFTYISPSGIL
jgi:hypothetical protein